MKISDLPDEYRDIAKRFLSPARGEDEIDIIQFDRLRTETNPTWVIVYHEKGSFNSLTERVALFNEKGGGANIISGMVRQYDSALMKAEDERRDAERKARACKHPRSAKELGLPLADDTTAC